MNTCSSCKYFCRGGHFKDGQCRRYPPDDNLRPSVKLSDWCGEYEQRDDCNEILDREKRDLIMSCQDIPSPPPITQPP